LPKTSASRQSPSCCVWILKCVAPSKPGSSLDCSFNPCCGSSPIETVQTRIRTNPPAVQNSHQRVVQVHLSATGAAGTEAKRERREKWRRQLGPRAEARRAPARGRRERPIGTAHPPPAVQAPSARVHPSGRVRTVAARRARGEARHPHRGAGRPVAARDGNRHPVAARDGHRQMARSPRPAGRSPRRPRRRRVRCWQVEPLSPASPAGSRSRAAIRTVGRSTV
jgi:hypothetical protein